MRGECSITAPGSMHKSSITKDMPSLCFFLDFNFQQPRWKHPNFQNAYCVLLFPSSPTPTPFSPSSVAVDGRPFFCSLEPPRKYWQSSISLTGRQPLPESRVGGISGFWTALRRESCKKQGTGTKTNSPFTVCFVPTRYLLTSKKLSISATHFSSSIPTVHFLCEPEAEAESQNIHLDFEFNFTSVASRPVLPVLITSRTRHASLMSPSDHNNASTIDKPIEFSLPSRWWWPAHSPAPSAWV
jgi:hypothetical protein